MIKIKPKMIFFLYVGLLVLTLVLNDILGLLLLLLGVASLALVTGHQDSLKKSLLFSLKLGLFYSLITLTFSPTTEPLLISWKFPLGVGTFQLGEEAFFNTLALMLRLILTLAIFQLSIRSINSSELFFILDKHAPRTGLVIASGFLFFTRLELAIKNASLVWRNRGLLDKTLPWSKRFDTGSVLLLNILDLSLREAMQISALLHLRGYNPLESPVEDALLPTAQAKPCHLDSEQEAS